MSKARPFLLSQLVASAAEQDPGGLALVDGESRLDYQTLSARIGSLSATLIEEGVMPDDRVVVYAPKSARSFEAIHATMAAGAIAVPIDPLAPSRTVSDVIAAVEPSAVVVAPETVDRLDTHALDRCVVGDVEGGIGWSEVSSVTPRGPVDRLGSDAAYLITTSGSSGPPKSIVHSHASGLRYAELAAECYGLSARDRMASIAGFHFDQSTFELYGGTLVGAAIVLISEAALAFPATVTQIAANEQITTLYSVPSVLRMLVERGALERVDLSSLRWVLFGGEMFPAAPLRRLMEHLPNARFSNVYGPAEVNQCTFHHLDGPPATDDIPIGRAWPDTALRIVDGAGHELTGCAIGELHVRSATMMSGYWKDPAATAESLIDDRCVDGSTHRWYRTGDLVERRSDGALSFRGRADRQVKIKGTRIELESVEAALGEVDGVTGAAAIVVDDDTPRLVAVIESAVLNDMAPLQKAAREALVPAARPERFLIVASLPRTTSGKIDVGATAELI